MDISLFIFVSMAMFAIGIIGLLTRRNALIFFLSIELMLNSANLLFVTFARHWGNQTGLVWVFFVLFVAAAEAAVGLAIIATISNGFILLGLKSHYQDIVKGAVIILAVALEGFARQSSVAHLAREKVADDEQSQSSM